MKFAPVTGICLISLVGVAMAERATVDPPHLGSATPAFIDDKGRSACGPGYAQYRGWCNLDRRAWSERFQYPMSEFVPGDAVSATWNAAHSAVCPQGYGYIAREGYCLPQKRPRTGYPSEHVPPEAVSAKWNKAGSAICPGGYDYFAGDDYCLPQQPRLWQYPMSEYVPREAVSAKWDKMGSAICPGNYDYFAREGYCLPKLRVRISLGEIVWLVNPRIQP